MVKASSIIGFFVHLHTLLALPKLVYYCDKFINYLNNLKFSKNANFKK